MKMTSLLFYILAAPAAGRQYYKNNFTAKKTTVSTAVLLPLFLFSVGILSSNASRIARAVYTSNL